MIRWLLKWSRKFSVFFHKLCYPNKIAFILVNEAPSDISSRRVYLEGADMEDLWFAYLKCPCGCKDTIMLNLIPDTKPCWTYLHDKLGNQSLTPSVNRKFQCKSHFWIKNNRIVIV
ncbi:DUF6527 family protein [Salinimicrobium sp. TIG7-5_MAKvit]|uniref:DUF6527 family protein n=1 Tax=Salinimicrobium sp. TIG7-5_MAKvit TaxID=3121289 RepID=UPI003C6DC7E7